MAIVQVAACSLDEDERKKCRALEFRMADELEENAARLAGPSLSLLLQSLGLTVALCEHDIRMRHVLLHFPRKHRTCGDWARRRERRFFDADR